VSPLLPDEGRCFRLHVEAPNVVKECLGIVEGVLGLPETSADDSSVPIERPHSP